MLPFRCPAGECAAPAGFTGRGLRCERGHEWKLTDTDLSCPKCSHLSKQVQVRSGLLACVKCAKTWKLDQAHATDDIAAGIVAGDSACDRAMRAVDEAVDLVVRGGALEAIAGGSTTLPELVGRFKRGLTHARFAQA